MSTRLTRRVLLGVAVPLAVLAGCGGEEAATTTAATIDPAAGADDTTPTTDPIVAETIPATAATTAATAATGGSEFCTLANEADILSDAWNPNEPASNQQFLTDLSGLLTAAAPVTPTELATDFPVFASTWAQITVAVAGHAWDFNALTAEEAALLQDPAFTSAGEAIDAYEAANC